MLTRQDLQFQYPADLIATEPVRPTRVMWVRDRVPQEISLRELKAQFAANDVLVINETRVLPRRVFSGGSEILFLSEESPSEWKVLFPSKGLRVGERLEIAPGLWMTLIEKGRPQRVSVSQPLTPEFFHTHGDLPLPPYIQKARGERQSVGRDQQWYQSAWSAVDGSLAAPTASLHFTNQDLLDLERLGVKVKKLVLHVGLGTFLPIASDHLSEHKMHSEVVFVPKETWQAVEDAKKSGHRIWALGTTVARSLESVARGLVAPVEGGFSGSTSLFLHPGEKWWVVDQLMTNFHQPESTLLALVASFCDLETVKSTYAWAIERRFRLFSYGDLTLWSRT